MRIAIIALFCVLTMPINAQIEKDTWHWEQIDSVDITCLYEYTYLNFLFPHERREIRENHILQIGRNLSKFYSLKSWQLDSLTSQPNGEQEIMKRKIKALSAPSRSRAQYDEMWHSTFPSYGMRYIIYKNYPKDSIMVQDAVGTNYYCYGDTLNSQLWQLEDDTLNVLGYRCHKASCEWRGRNYTAWYAEEIPVSDGPYKFAGLPGLIMRVYDKDHEYEWTIKGIQREHRRGIFLSTPVNYDAKKQYVPITRRDLLRKHSREYIGIAKKLNADDVMLGNEPHISDGIRDLIERDYLLR